MVGSVANSSQGNTRKAIRAPELTVSAFFLFCRQGGGEGKEKGHRLNQPERQKKETKNLGAELQRTPSLVHRTVQQQRPAEFVTKRF